MAAITKSALCGALLLILFTNLATTASGSEPFFPFAYETVELENGLKAYMIRAGAPGQIAYVTMVRTGSRDEVEEGRTGFAHFFEHMMFSGTEKYPLYDAETEKMGAARNAFTTNNETVYHLVAASEYLEKIMDLESDRFRNLSYSETNFRTEAGAVLGEYQNSASSPFRVLDKAIRELAYTEHTYRHSTIGFEADIRAMPEGFEYSKSFYSRFYRPENCVVVIVGDFDLGKTRKLIEQYYGSWEAGYQAPSIPAEPVQTAPRSANITYPGQTLPILSISYRAPAWNPTDRIGVAAQILGDVAFGENSDLYRKLVINEQRVQFLGPSFSLSRDPGLIDITTMIKDPGDIEKITGEILATVEQYKDSLIDETTLAATKSNLKYSFLMNLETARDVGFSLITPIVNTGSLEPIEDYYRTLDSITPEDVRNAARELLKDEGRNQILMKQAGR